MSRLHLKIYGPQGLEWELAAPKAAGYTTENFMKAYDLLLTLYEEGEKSTEIHSDEGLVLTDASSPAETPEAPREVDGRLLNKGDMFLNGNVVVVSTEGARLEADWLWYHKGPDLITSSAPVRVFREGSVTHGTGLEATPDLSRVQIFNQTIVINNEEDEDNKKDPSEDER